MVPGESQGQYCAIFLPCISSSNGGCAGNEFHRGWQEKSGLLTQCQEDIPGISNIAKGQRQQM